MAAVYGVLIVGQGIKQNHRYIVEAPNEDQAKRKAFDVWKKTARGEMERIWVSIVGPASELAAKGDVKHTIAGKEITYKHVGLLGSYRPTDANTTTVIK